MQNVYEKYGYYLEGGISIVLEGADGAEQIKNKMTIMRNTPPTKLADWDVTEVRDYKEHTIVRANGEKGVTDLPTSNVLYYDLEDNAWCCVRPSGTEPKVKFYMGVKGKSLEDAEKKLAEVKKSMMDLSE